MSAHREKLRAAFVRGFEMWVFRGKHGPRPSDENEACGFEAATYANEHGARPCAGDAPAAWDRFAKDFDPYWQLIVPSVPPALATVWHPTERGGTFDPLCRGGFKTEEEAITWGRVHLAGTPYSLRWTDPLAELGA